MIRHQTQPTYNSCVTTCLAMLANKDAEDVVQKYHNRYWDDPSSIIHIMDELDIVAVPCSVLGSTLYTGQAYMLVMPSLNIERGTHQIIVDLRDCEIKVFDPARGRIGSDGAGSLYYTDDTVFSGNWYAEWRILDCPAFREH